MNYLVFNKNCVINIPSIEGNDTIVRTGGTPFNETDPFISLVNTLLHSNIKKFSSLAENERNSKIQKLKDDISIKIKNSENIKSKVSLFGNEYRSRPHAENRRHTPGAEGSALRPEPFVSSLPPKTRSLENADESLSIVRVHFDLRLWSMVDR